MGRELGRRFVEGRTGAHVRTVSKENRRWLHAGGDADRHGGGAGGFGGGGAIGAGLGAAQREQPQRRDRASFCTEGIGVYAGAATRGTSGTATYV